MAPVDDILGGGGRGGAVASPPDRGGRGAGTLPAAGGGIGGRERGGEVGRGPMTGGVGGGGGRLAARGRPRDPPPCETVSGSSLSRSMPSSSTGRGADLGRGEIGAGGCRGSGAGLQDSPHTLSLLVRESVGKPRSSRARCNASRVECSAVRTSAESESAARSAATAGPGAGC